MSTSKKGKGKASSPSQGDGVSKLIPSRIQRERFVSHFQKMTVLFPRFGNLDNFYSECFSFPALFRSQGIYKLIGVNGPIYPTLVRIFYNNLTITRGCMISNVNGVPIELTVQNFGEALGIPHDGACIKLLSNANLPGYNKRDFYYGIARIPERDFIQKRQRLIGGTPERNSWSAGILTIDDRLIHYFLAYVVMPKFSNISNVNDCEMQILYAMKNGIQINWSYVILHHMALHNENASALPYGSWLTLVFEKFNVPLSGEHMVPMTNPKHEITPKKVCNTKTDIKFDPINRTITYIHTPPQNQPPQEQPLQNQPPQPMENSFNQVFDYLQYMNNNMNNQFAHLYAHTNVPPYEAQPYHYPFIQPQTNEGNDGEDQDDEDFVEGMDD